ncbi:MAG: hypothetical protein QOD53_2135 [Thermoleophilaceae bacterium]|nr:hypothetical protein [Thermoleophilaceae bacterium]
MTQEWLPPHHANCLGCGDENPAGLGMRMRRDGERVRGEVTLDRRHEGAPGYAHGGAVSTVLDDALGMLLFILRRPAVTARLEVDFRRPAYLERPFEVEAWVDSIDGRKLHLAARMREGEELIAEGRALFLEVDVEHFARGARMADGGESRRLPW